MSDKKIDISVLIIWGVVGGVIGAFLGTVLTGFIIGAIAYLAIVLIVLPICEAFIRYLSK